MTRWLVVCVSCLALFCGLTACRTQNVEMERMADSALTTAPQVNIVTGAGEIPLSDADAKALATVLRQGQWIQHTADCACDYWLTVSDEMLGYHSSCGTFNDHVNDCCLSTSEDTQQQVNLILAKYALPVQEG